MASCQIKIGNDNILSDLQLATMKCVLSAGCSFFMSKYRFEYNISAFCIVKDLISLISFVRNCRLFELLPHDLKRMVNCCTIQCRNSYIFDR